MPSQITESLNVFLVGGAVRDELLNRDIVERDYLVVGSTVEEMLSLGFQQVGKDFPVFLHPETKDEYALARTEKKQGSGYTGFECYAAPDVTIEEDLLRRDLTVNAMAKTASGEIIDPYNGSQDLKNRVLRHVSDAFVEDPLRVLRVARFAARYHQYDFTIAPETMGLMAEIAASGELTELSSERVFKELQRALLEPNPEVFIESLRLCGALKSLLPEIDKLWGIPNPAKWHPEICSGVHTLMVLEQAVKLSKKGEVRFAALLHDLGKGNTPKEKWPSHHGHEKSGLKQVKQVCRRLKVPSSYQSLAMKVCEFHLHCHKAFELRADTILRVFNQLDLWRKPEEFEDFLLACSADMKGRTGFENADYPQADFLRQVSNACLKISAKQFVAQGLQGKAIKEALDAARIVEISRIKGHFVQ